MSGHSKWSSIKHKKGATDAKRGKIFTRIIKEISVAARLGGGDPDGNPRLRTAIMNAKSNNMPADNITRAIKKGTGELAGVHYEETTYEGYGPGGAAIFLEAMTDNKNRTVSEIRTAFGKAGGNLGENGCVGWMFEKKGIITVTKETSSEDDLMELATDAGADDLQTVDGHYEVTTTVENFEEVRKAIEGAGIPMDTAEVTRVPQNTVSLDEKKGKALLKLMDILEDHDDIQKAYCNFDIADDVMAAILENH